MYECTNARMHQTCIRFALVRFCVLALTNHRMRGLSTQFRLALVSKESNLRSPQQIQGHFARVGVPMWGSRAEQVYHTVSKFSREQLEQGLKLIFAADRDLRHPRPDDRIVMERFVLELTS